MNKNTIFSSRSSARKAYKFSTISLAVVIGLVTHATAFAQTQSAPSQDVETESQDVETEKVLVITGSRLQRVGINSPIPVTSIDASDIRVSGATNLVDVVNELPALGQNGADSRNNFRGSNSIGTSLLNLRSLGANRTLVVIDGRRHVGGVAGGSGVDINTIPRALVDRVEVSTGGASVAYGADALTGVVNFIQKKSFDGIQIDGQYGTSDRSDGENSYISITGGDGFLDGRLNAMFNFTYDNSEAIKGTDRDFISSQDFYGVNPADTGPNDGIPAQILYNDARINVTNSTGILFGLFTGSIGPGGLFTFNEQGGFEPFDFGTPLGGSFSQGGDGFNLAEVIEVQNPVERAMFNVILNYDLSDSSTLFLEAKHVSTEASNVDQPTGDFFSFLDGDRSSFFLSEDNPFLPFDDPNFANFFNANSIPGVGNFVLFSRFHTDLGRRSTIVNRDLTRILVGTEGSLDWLNSDYEVSYQYGKTEYDTLATNSRNSRRFALAVDAVSDSNGNPICRSTRDSGGSSGDPDIDQCLPLNIFGFNNFDPAARDYVSVDLLSRGELEQSIVSASLSGELFEFGGDVVRFATGFEWRSEKSSFDPDQLIISGNNFDGQSPVVRGEFEVAETYAEILIPLLTDQPFAKSLEIEGGVRISDYDTVGTTDAYRANISWVPIDELRFRAGVAEAVRAPNINELFRPQDEGAGGVTDPCSAENIGNGVNPQQRALNCASLGIPSGYTDPLASVTKTLITGGNPNLDVETATSTTYGVVIEPLENLVLTIDYFDVEIEKAVFTESATSIASKCVDLFDNVDNEFCAKIQRDPNSFAINSVDVLPDNIGFLEVNGVDFQIDYTTNLGDFGSLQSRVIGSHLKELNVVPNGDFSQIDRQAGEIGAPEWEGSLNLVWNLNQMSVAWTTRYIGKSEFNVEDNDIEARGSKGFGSHFVNDVQASYRFEFEIPFTAYVGINNLFDKAPPRGSRNATGFQNTMYDPILRYYYAGISLNF